MPTLLLQRLNDDQDHYETVAQWNTEREDNPPEAFTRIYPEDMWHGHSIQYFLERIDGPYTILSQVEQMANNPNQGHPG